MLELRAIDESNHLSLRALKVRPEQETLVASVDKSLADAYIYTDAVFRGIYHGEIPVGYTLVFPYHQDNQRYVNIVRFMIASEHQGQGLGRQALGLVIQWISSFSPTPQQLRISTRPDNTPALNLYRSAGFTEQGMEDGEVALYCSLP